MSRPKRGTRQNRTPVLHGLPTPNAGLRRTARRAVEKIEKEILQKRLTDEKAILKELENQYMTAIEAINWRIGNLLWRKDADLPNVIHQVQYQRAIKAQIQAALDRLHAGEYESIQQYLKDSYTDGYVGAMYTLHESGAPVIAPIDQDAAIRAITIESKLREPLYDSLGVDLRKLKTSIASEITRGISMGQSYDRIARNISLLTKAPLSRAKTIVRTEAGRVQEQAAYAAGQKAIAAGANVVKQWSAVLDGKTREDHRRLDHQVREMGEAFEVNGQKAQYPHGFDDPKQDCNCRCTLLVISRSMMDADELKRMQERAEFFGLDKTKDFEEFREKYLKASDQQEYNMARASKIEANGLFVNRNEKLHRYAKNIEPLEGYEDFTCHADADNFYIDLGGAGKEGDFFKLTPQEYAERIKASPTYKGGNVRIISCQAGAKEDGAAQRLADALGVSVYAPTEAVHVTENGEMFVSNNDILAEIWYNEDDRSTIKQTGEWKVFKPRKE